MNIKVQSPKTEDGVPPSRDPPQRIRPNKKKTANRKRNRSRRRKNKPMRVRSVPPSRSLLQGSVFNETADVQRYTDTPPIIQDGKVHGHHTNPLYKVKPPRGSAVCANDPCGHEVACFPRGDSFTCICSDATEINPGEECPMEIRVNMTPPAILLPQTRENHPPLHQIAILSIVMGLFVALILLIIFGFRSKKGIKTLIKNNKTTNEEKLPDNVAKMQSFYAQSLMNNPSYYSANQNETIALSQLTVKTIPPTQIRFIKVVGEGCFGKVFKGEYTPEEDDVKKVGMDQQIVAVKVLKELVGIEAQADFLREVEIVSSFKHKNILSLIGVVVTDIGQTPWMVFEFMPYGDLAEMLRDYDRKTYVNATNLKITKDDLMNICINIAEGMTYLASQHFVHRDLACRNCLVGENFTVKISDFGMSRDVYTCDYYKVGGSRMLPVRWMAPESILYGKFTLESDVWAFGVVLWEVYSFGKQPYYGNSNEDAVKLILQNILLSPPETCPQGVLQVMKLCWSSEAHNRPTFSEILHYLYKVEHKEAIPDTKDLTSLLNYSQLCMTEHDSVFDQDQYLLPKFNVSSEYLKVLNHSHD